MVDHGQCFAAMAPACSAHVGHYFVRKQLPRLALRRRGSGPLGNRELRPKRNEAIPELEPERGANPAVPLRPVGSPELPPIQPRPYRPHDRLFQGKLQPHGS